MGLSKAGNSSANLFEIDLKILLLFSKLLLIIFDLIDFPSLASYRYYTLVTSFFSLFLAIIYKKMGLFIFDWIF